jgi:hypothetical protein
MYQLLLCQVKFDEILLGYYSRKKDSNTRKLTEIKGDRLPAVWPLLSCTNAGSVCLGRKNLLTVLGYDFRGII